MEGASHLEVRGERPWGTAYYMASGGMLNGALEPLPKGLKCPARAISSWGFISVAEGAPDRREVMSLCGHVSWTQCDACLPAAPTPTPRSFLEHEETPQGLLLRPAAFSWVNQPSTHGLGLTPSFSSDSHMLLLWGAPEFTGLSLYCT